MSTIADIDSRHLARAIELAERGRGKVSPNPLVGAVLADAQEVIAEGFHSELGAAHAEVEAIRAAGDRNLAGSTLYVSLEPCCHQGRTPPCTDAIREAAGAARGILRNDGAEVVMVDVELADRPRLLNQPFRKHARTGRPWVL